MMSQDFDKQLIWLKYFSGILTVSLNTQGGASPRGHWGLECQPHCRPFFDSSVGTATLGCPAEQRSATSVCSKNTIELRSTGQPRAVPT